MLLENENSAPLKIERVVAANLGKVSNKKPDVGKRHRFFYSSRGKRLFFVMFESFH